MAVVKGNALKTILTKLKDFFALKEDVVTSVNEVQPIDGDVHLEEVYFAENIKSDKTQNSSGDYLIRTSGGEASITDGDAFLSAIKGNSIHTGSVQEVLETDIYAQEGSTLEVSVDRDTFVNYVTSSQYLEFTYISNSWGEDLSVYGIIVSGTPVENDVIRINYVKLQRGTITNSNPTSFKSTGWNLYNNGYARLVKYSEQYGFYIDGDYETVSFAESMSSITWEEITVTNHLFMIPSTGYVRVTGGSSNTYILNTWSDWTEGYPEEEIDPYVESTVDISSIMSSYYPYGLCKIGNVQDEINLDIGFAYSRIGRIAYDSTNYDEKIAPIIENGYAYDVDTSYIYYVKPITNTPPEGIEPQIAYPITINGRYDVSDHGYEFIVTSNNIPVSIETMYMNNLKNKLERDVLTISQQTLTQQQKNQVYENLSLDEINSKLIDFTPDKEIEIGTWVDGKKLYKIMIDKAISISSSSGSTDKTIVDIGTGKSIVRIESPMIKASAAWYVMPYCNMSSGASTNLLTSANHQTIICRVYKDTWTSGRFTATVYYTYNNE